MRESGLQKKVIEACNEGNYRAFPIEYRGSRDCPDLMVFACDCPRMVAFLELKQPKTGRASFGQLHNAALFEEWGHNVGFVDNVADALWHLRKVFYGEEKTTANEIQKDDAPDVRHVPRKKAVQRLPYSTDGN